MSLANLVANHRVSEMGFTAPEDLRREFPKIFWNEEPGDSDPIPRELISEERIREGLSLTLPSTFKGLGLELRMNPINFEALFEFLAQRMRYWDVDIDHPQYLPDTE